MDRLDRIEIILEKVAKSQAESDRQRAKDKADANEENRDLRRHLRKIGSQLGHEGNRMGQIAEAVVADSLKNFMKEHFAIEFHYIIRRFHIEHLLSGDSSEIDVLGLNGDFAVAIEVKTTLDKSHVNNFNNRILARYDQISPSNKLFDIRRKKVYGGIAYLNTKSKKNGDSSNESLIIKHAEKMGIFVMKIFGKNNTKLVNSKGFVLKNHRRR